MKKYIIGITGASGSAIPKEILTFLSHCEFEINVILTDNGKQVFAYETAIVFNEFLNTIAQNKAKMILHDNSNLFAAVASGSYETDGMIIAPCSMATAAKIATGTGDSLLCRAADVCLKEKTRLVISPRETPFNTIHLKNLLALSENGAVIVPPVPMFYTKENNYDSMIKGIAGRILKSAGIQNNLYQKWEGNKNEM